MTLNVQGGLLVMQEKPLANASPVAINGSNIWINFNSVHNVEVINSSTENNEHSQTSNEKKTIEEHPKK